MVNRQIVWQLFLKEARIDWRQRSALNGILLYVVSAVFTVFLSVRMIPSPPLWNAVMWVILLFASINAVGRSFMGESKGKHMYYQQLAKPLELIIAKILYNILLNAVISLFCLLVYTLFLGNPISFIGSFITIVFLGGIGFSIMFTLLSAIASKAGNSHLLMPVLSFPIVIPFLLILIRSSKKAMDGVDLSLLVTDIWVLLFYNAILFLMAGLLFPFLWKE